MQDVWGKCSDVEVEPEKSTTLMLECAERNERQYLSGVIACAHAGVSGREWRGLPSCSSAHENRVDSFGCVWSAVRYVS